MLVPLRTRDRQEGNAHRRGTEARDHRRLGEILDVDARLRGAADVGRRAERAKPLVSRLDPRDAAGADQKVDVDAADPGLQRQVPLALADDLADERHWMAAKHQAAETERAARRDQGGGVGEAESLSRIA